ncbi:MAG: alkaline phosphatase [Bacteroidia bacterium]
MRNTILLLPLLLFACRSVPETTTVRTAPRPRNVILMVGDGMGLTQVSAGMYSVTQPLHLERCPVVGLSKTYSADDLITDSAAGATAFATGKKTYNGAIGVDTDTAALPTILEIAERQGYATGLVATCEITHATPASFAAHRASRNMHEEIALDMSSQNIELLIGGGQGYFERRADGNNLVAVLRANGYLVRNHSFAFEDLQIPQGQRLIYFTADGDPVRKSKGRDYLPAASAFAPRFLSSFDAPGFFLMIEGSQIDWGGHANDGAYVISEMLDFDAAIGEVLDFAAQDKHTLVVITADHETGGMAIQTGSTRGNLTTAFTSGKHTGVMVPVFAYGPGAELFSGIYENTAIFDKMMEALRLPLP